MSLKKIAALGTLLCFQCFFGQNVRDSVPNKLQEVVISSMHINDSLLNAPAAIGILSPKDLHETI